MYAIRSYYDGSNLALDIGAGLIGFRERYPRIVGELLYAEADAVGFRIVLDYHALDFLVLSQLAARVLHLFGPRKIVDVKESVNAFLKLNEGSRIGNLYDLAG